MYANCRRCIHPARYPRKVLRVIEARQHLRLGSEIVGGIDMHHLREHLGCGRTVFAQLRRIHIHRIHLHRHRQFAQVAVVQNASPRRNREGAVLLALGLIHPL